MKFPKPEVGQWLWAVDLDDINYSARVTDVGFDNFTVLIHGREYECRLSDWGSYDEDFLFTLQPEARVSRGPYRFSGMQLPGMN